MEFTEQQVYEAMGMSAPEEPTQQPTGGNEPGIAEPAAEETHGTPEGGTDGGTGGANAAGANPEGNGAREPDAEPGEPEGAENGAAAGEPEGKHEQTPDERRAHAAARRRAEQQAAVDEALKKQSEKMSAEWKAFFEKAGLKNTMTGEPITSKEDFDAWQKEYAQQKLESDLAAGKLTQESLNAAISENPIVKQAAEIVAAREREQAAAEEARMQREIDSQIEKIHALEPEINGVEDLLKIPESEDFYARVKGGASFLDAYLLATRERRERTLAEAAKVQAASNARGKDHLTGSAASRGAGGRAVSSNEIAQFRVFNPTATEAEIRAWIEKHQ